MGETQKYVDIKEDSLDIVTYPHPSLRLECKPLKLVDKQVKEWIVDMFKTMYAHNGVGLAANQVGLPYRMFVMTCGGDDFAYINPRINNYFGGVTESKEGCLSLPGIYGQVRRNRKIKISSYNLKGEATSTTLGGNHSKIFQHELDHLDGVMFVERMTDFALGEVEVKLKRMIAEWTAKVDDGTVNESVILEKMTALEKERC